MRPKTKSCFSQLHLNVLAAILAMLLLSACGGSGSQSDSLRIGVVLYAQDDTFISSMSQNLEQLVQEEESRIGQKITLFISDSRHNQTTQMDQVDRFLARGCDILCVNIVDRTAAAVIVDKAEAEGVPLIFFNRQPVDEDIRRWNQTYYVGASAQESGALEGQLVVDAWTSNQEHWDRSGDGVLQYVMLEGEPGHQDSLLRTEYTIQTITDGGIEVERLARDTANWNRAQAAARISHWLEEFGAQIEVVLCNNDDMALGAIDALERAQTEGVNVIGIDGTTPGLEALENGKLLGTVSANKEIYCSAVLELAASCALGETLPEEYPLTDGTYFWTPQEILITTIKENP